MKDLLASDHYHSPCQPAVQFVRGTERDWGCPTVAGTAVSHPLGLVQRSARDETILEGIARVISGLLNTLCTLQAVSGANDQRHCTWSVDITGGKLGLHLMKPESMVFRPERGKPQRARGKAGAGATLCAGNRPILSIHDGRMWRGQAGVDS